MKIKVNEEITVEIDNKKIVMTREEITELRDELNGILCDQDLTQPWFPSDGTLWSRPWVQPPNIT